MPHFTNLLVQVDKDKLTFVFEMEGQTCPVVKPDRIGCIAVFSDPQPGCAENCRLPDSTRTCGMNTFRGIPTQVLQVYQCTFHKQIIGLFSMTKFAGQNDMECWRKRGTIIVVSNRIVVVPVDLFGLAIKFPYLDGKEHQDISLFDNLVLLDFLDPDNTLI